MYRFNRFGFIALAALMLTLPIVPASPAGIIYVKTDGNDANDGSTSALAKATVQAGLNAAVSGDEVWVALGTYVEDITLKEGVGLYGGFAGTETAREQRDWQLNDTVIDGGGGGQVVTGANSSTIDGFTIRTGWDGIYCDYSSPTITNNTIVQNTGSGIYSRNGSPTIANNTVAGNSQAICCDYSSPTITNNTIVGNTWGILCYSGSPAITNNVVAFNTTGIHGSEGAVPVLSHNDVYGNTTDYDGVTAGTGDISEDPQFGCLGMGDLHIQPTSPCRDAGNNSAPGLPDEDMDGQARNDGGGIDIGADESHGEQWPPCTPRIIRVDGSASPGGDGTSWTNAYQTIGDAVDDVAESGGAEIWVAEGVYSENVSLVPFAHTYGGFAGMESQRSERDWHNNVTVIDGGGSGNAVAGANISTIDGFTIRNGWTGIYCSSSSPTIANNTIVGNSNDGIYCSYGSPTITNNTVVGNEWSGAYCSYGSATITNNTMSANYDGINCGDGSPTITNNVIVGNWEGIYCIHGSPTITNNTILGNSDEGIYCCYSGTTPNISNNILAFNAAGICGSEGAAPVLSHNDVYGNTTDYDGVTPGTGDISQDPQFVCYDMGDLHIQPTSPCRNAGDNSAPGLPDTDMDGQARNDSGGVDIGADESYGEQWPPCPEPRIIHVDWSASAGGDGTSWANAYQTIGDAVGDVIRNGGAEIWVAEGVYSENVRLVPFAYLYGGFTGTESQRSKRNWQNNVAVIDGGGSGNVVTGANISTIDGFTIRNGDYGICCSYSSPSITNNTIVGNSYGIDCYLSSPSITNNTIVGNSDDGIYCSYGSPTITNNTMVGNSSDGIYCYDSSSTITNNILAFNTGGICGYSGAPVLSHNDVYGNTTDYDGVIPGTGDISADPLLVDWVGGDYHLTAASPCVNAGWNDAPGLALFDMDGEGRIFGGTVDIGADEFWSSSMSVADAKRAPDGAAITGDGAIVSETFPDFFYIEADDRSSGIRVDKAGHGLTEGVRADVAGSVQTNPDGERHIAADSATASGTDTVSPVGLANKLLGGGDWFYNPATGAGQKGIAGGCGLNNIGLLIRTWGTVTYADADYFYLDDGSLLDDGAGHLGVKVLATGLIIPADGTHVEVTGISSCFKDGDDLHRLIRVCDQAGIVVME